MVGSCMFKNIILPMILHFIFYKTKAMFDIALEIF